VSNSSLAANTKFGAAVSPSGLTVPAVVLADGVLGNLIHVANNYDGTSSLVPQTRLWASGTVTDPVQQISGFSATVSASGTTSDIDISMISVVLGTVKVGAPSGTNPTLDVYFEVKDALGNYLPVITFTQQTGNSLTYATAGPGTANVYPLTKYARFRWTLGGTAGPGFANAALALAGR
jgi:hypothetical protein